MSDPLSLDLALRARAQSNPARARHDPAKPLPPGVRITDSLDGLAAIHAPDCAAVICAWSGGAALRDWLAGLPVECLPRTREIVRPDAIGAALTRVCAPMPDVPERSAFIESIATLADRFATTLQAPWLLMRLEVVTGNACRRFHVDNVTARLVCTCRGTGTQYGQAEAGAEPEVIHTVPQGQPILLRGMRWPTTPPSLLKPRSPPIEGTGEARLLLVLDPVLDPEDEV